MENTKEKLSGKLNNISRAIEDLLRGLQNIFQLSGNTNGLVFWIITHCPECRTMLDVKPGPAFGGIILPGKPNNGNAQSHWHCPHCNKDFAMEGIALNNQQQPISENK